MFITTVIAFKINMKEKFLIISDSLPVDGGKAENSINKTLCELFIANKKQIDFLFIENTSSLVKQINQLKIDTKIKKKITFFKIKVKTENILKNKIFNLLNIFNRIVDSSTLIKKYKFFKKTNLNYDYVVCWSPIAYKICNKYINAKNKLFILGDPPAERLYVNHKINFFQNNFFLALFKFLIFYVCLYYEKYYWIKRIDKNTFLGIFGTSSAKRFSNKINCKDLRPVLSEYKIKKSASFKKTKIVLAGSLNSTFSKNTLNLFRKISIHFKENKEILFYLYGHEIKNKNQYSGNINLIKNSKDFETQLEKYNIFMMPSNYYVGVRTRLCSALAAGNYCIVSKSILYNMPEIKNCSSVKIVNNNESEFIDEILNYSSFPIRKKIKLKKISNNFFLKNYTKNFSGKKFLLS